MIRPTKNIIRITQTGARISILAADYTYEDLLEIAAVYAQFEEEHSALGLFIRPSDLDMNQITAICEAAKGHVVLSRISKKKQA